MEPPSSIAPVEGEVQTSGAASCLQVGPVHCLDVSAMTALREEFGAVISAKYLFFFYEATMLHF